MMIQNVLYAVVATVLPVFAQHGYNYSQTMGPVAFMWPPDREWGATQDNTAPCGSAAGVVNRTQFPLVNGQIALVAQDESWYVQIAISYSNAPTSNNDFCTIIDSHRIPEIDDGHTCFRVPNSNATDNIQAGSNATLQMMYTSDMEDNQNETYYACADITYVIAELFTYQVPCFNATDKEFNITDNNSTRASATVSSDDASDTVHSASSGADHTGLSGGAIAGIVIGVIVGLVAIATVAFFLWRQKEQLRRLRNQGASVRQVKWDDTSASDTSTRSDAKGQGQDIALTEMRK